MAVGHGGLDGRDVVVVVVQVVLAEGDAKEGAAVNAVAGREHGLRGDQSRSAEPSAADALEGDQPGELVGGALVAVDDALLNC